MLVRQVVGQTAPGTTRAEKVPEGVPNFSAWHHHRPALPTGQRPPMDEYEPWAFGVNHWDQVCVPWGDCVSCDVGTLVDLCFDASSILPCPPIPCPF